MMHPAIAFLRLLDPSPDASFNIETYTDVAKGGAKARPDPLGRRYPNLSIEQVTAEVPELEAINARGAGVFVAVNQCQGQRSKKTVIRIRGVHAEFDGVTDDKLAAIRLRLPPTIEVRSSSASNCHFYWLLKEEENMPPDLAEAINQGLVELGADPAATDISRLLRLPGFRHMKRWNGGAQ
jgi:hypothetical protein